MLPLGAGDLIDCLRLDRLALGGLWSEEQWRRELEEPNRPVLGIRQQGVLIALASAWLVVDEVHVTAVAVHPERRRMGLGRSVMEGLLGTARLAGAMHATLEVSSDNKAAQGLYAALGFRKIGIRRGYYRNGNDALILMMRLGGSSQASVLESE